MPRKTYIHRTYNIPEELIVLAEYNGLTAIATGGNTDYICKVVGKNHDDSDRLVILSSGEGGGTPDKPSEPSELIIMMDEGWHDQVGIPVRTAEEGIVLMSRMYDPYAPEGTR